MPSLLVRANTNSPAGLYGPVPSKSVDGPTMAPDLSYSSTTLLDSSAYTPVDAPNLAGTSVTTRELAWLQNQGYRISAQLASGSNGTVFKAISMKTGAPVALKAVPVTNLTACERKRLRLEIVALKRTTHRHVLKFVDALESDENVYIVTELMKEDLFDRTTRKVLTEAEAIEVARQILLALKYLHKRGVYHRDIKLENIMVSDDIAAEESSSSESDDSSTGSICVKLVDFGGVYMAPSPPPSTEIVLSPSSRDGFGTTFYLPPEVVRQEDYRPGAVDTWGLGVVLYSAMTGHFPFFGNTNSVVYEMICRRAPAFEEAQWQGISEEFKDFIRLLLCKEANSRASVDEALEALPESSVEDPSPVPSLRTKRERKQTFAGIGHLGPSNKKKGLRAPFFQRKRLE